MIGQDRASIDEYVKATGRIPAGVMFYTSIQKLTGLNDPWNNGSGVHHGKYLLEKYPHSALQIGLYMVGALERVNQGAYDKNIDRLAQWIKLTGRPVYLRIGYEFDNKENHYEPASYREAFRRIVDRFRKLGVTNAAFVWHSGSYVNEPRDPFLWYPGDDYVDWFAISFFAPLQYQKAKSFAARAKEKGNPFMIAESTPAGTYTPFAKMDWFKKFFRLIDEVRPQAVCYINSDWDSMPMWKYMKWGDSRVQQSPDLKKMWLDEITKVRYINSENTEKPVPENPANPGS